ncbi:MAG TPA: HDOD domain-containing protein [Thermoguttaceae bacterium]|nr:HDOD domain-containing protein [Thermoguttaceae bacterium]
MPSLPTQATTTSPALRRLVREIDDISTLPHVADRATQAAADPNVEAADLRQLLESDPALSARVLRYVKSSDCPVRDQITNLQQAVFYLGTKQIRDLAMTAGVSDRFRTDLMIGTYQRSQLWQHSVAVGVCSRMIAKRRKLADPEDVFLAGLLHDVGIILEDQYRHDAFFEVIRSLQEDLTLTEAERNHLGFDHTALGERVGQRWEFPDAVIAAIRYHHVSVGYRGDHIDTVRCVEVANLICTLRGIPSVGVKLVKFSRTAFAGLSLAREDVAGLIEELDEELTGHSDLTHA